MALRRIFEKNMPPVCVDGVMTVYVYFEGYCNSEDTKPTDLVANGSNLIEVDTGNWYFYNEESGEWVVKFNITSGGGGEAKPTTVTITPTAATQTVVPSSLGDFNYFSSVTVNGDSNLIAANIKKGVEIFGVTGTFEIACTDPNNDGNVTLVGGTVTDSGSGTPSIGG